MSGERYAGFKPGFNSRGMPSQDADPDAGANFALTKDPQFIAACERATEYMKERGMLNAVYGGRGGKRKEIHPAEIRPTVRQAAKYRRKTGAAYQFGREVPSA